MSKNDNLTSQIKSLVEKIVLYEDNHIIAVNKPHNMLVQSDMTGETSLFDHVKDYIKIKYEKEGNVFLGILHRLDRPVSGVVLFAKTSKAASRISQAIREHKFEKTYYAIVNGILETKADKLENYLTKQTNKMGSIAKVVFEDTAMSKKAVLHYKVIGEDVNKNLSMLEINLETGRFHQIRVQLAVMGHAILGDKKYGNYVNSNKESIPLALIAKKIRFKHPTKDLMVEIEAKNLNMKPWNNFIFKK